LLVLLKGKNEFSGCIVEFDTLDEFPEVLLIVVGDDEIVTTVTFDVMFVELLLVLFTLPGAIEEFVAETFAVVFVFEAFVAVTFVVAFVEFVMLVLLEAVEFVPFVAFVLFVVLELLVTFVLFDAFVLFARFAKTFWATILNVKF